MGDYEWTETLGDNGYLNERPIFYNSEKDTYLFSGPYDGGYWIIGSKLGGLGYYMQYLDKETPWFDPNKPCPSDIDLYVDINENSAPEISVTVTKASDPDNVVPKPSTEQPKTTSTKTTTKTTTKSTTTTTTTTEAATTTTVEDTEDTTEGSI